jgi:uncharacterized protein (TIGR02246 family)
MVIHTNPASREDDEQSIRELIETWHCATATGDLPQLLKLMSEDVVFLVVGQPPMRGRDAFATGFQQALQHYRIKPSGKIQEIHTTEDWAYCWTNLSVTMVPLQSGSPIHRAGNTLTILHKQADGTWVIVRDANLLSIEPSTPH